MAPARWLVTVRRVENVTGEVRTYETLNRTWDVPEVLGKSIMNSCVLGEHYESSGVGKPKGRKKRVTPRRT